MVPLQTVEEATVIDDNVLENKFTIGGCCCWIPCRPAVRSIWWERIGTEDSRAPTINGEEKWWKRGWKKVRAWSELVAGPRWKTFIRRFNKNNRSVTGGQKFRYDPLSYALNFDEGPGHNGHVDEDVLSRNFSSRYASLPASAKSSMDLGKDGPTFM